MSDDNGRFLPDSRKPSQLAWVQEDDKGNLQPYQFVSTKELFQELMQRLASEKAAVEMPDAREVAVCLTTVEDAWYRYFYMLRKNSLLDAQQSIISSVTEGESHE